MRLCRLLDPGVTVQGAAWQQVEITALAADSRAVRPGTLFAALPGSRADGRAFIDDALTRGAAAVLALIHLGVTAIVAAGNFGTGAACKRTLGVPCANPVALVVQQGAILASVLAATAASGALGTTS